MSAILDEAAPHDAAEERPVPARRRPTAADAVAEDLEKFEDRASGRLDRVEGDVDGIRGEIRALRADLTTGLASVNTALVGLISTLGRFVLVGVVITLVVSLVAMASLVGGVIYFRGMGLDVGSGTSVTTTTPKGVTEVRTGPRVVMTPAPSETDSPEEVP